CLCIDAGALAPAPSRLAPRLRPRPRLPAPEPSPRPPPSTPSDRRRPRSPRRPAEVLCVQFAAAMSPTERTRTFRVYVSELNPEIFGEDRRFRERNPQYVPGHECL